MEPKCRNLVVVVVDALRTDRVGLYGGRELTPTLDALESESTVFENAFSCINTTDPSITSINTGRYPRNTVIHHGELVTDEEKSRAEAAVTMPEELARNGLETIAAGRPLARWHSNGFTTYPTPKHHPILGPIRDVLQAVSPRLREYAGELLQQTRKTKDDLSSNESTEVDTFLSHLGTGPFYGFIHLMDTHTPYKPDPDRIDEVLEKFEYPEGDLSEFFEEHSENPMLTEAIKSWVTEADYEIGLGRLLARYDATVLETDAKIGALIAGLKNKGMWDETALIVLSDHGESLDEHGIYFDHHGLYDESIHVPLLCRIPGTNGGRVEEFVQLTDLAPTILDILCPNVEFECDGKSLLPLIEQSGEWESRQFIYTEEAHTQRRISVRSDQWKLIAHRSDPRLEEVRDDSLRCGYCHTLHGNRVELYNLTDDPDEEMNVAADNPDVVSTLESQFDDFVEGLSPLEIADETIEYEREQEVMQRLEDLGYR